MFSKGLLLFASLSAGIVLCEKQLCDPDDGECLTKGAVRTYKRFIAGIDGLEPSDPLHVDLIEGNLPTLKYKLINGSLIGMMNCQVDLAQIFVKNLTYNYHIGCPYLILEADFDVKGKLGPQFVEGNGTCKLDIYDYNFVFNGDFEKFISTVGKLHIQLVNHILEYEAKAKVNYDCKHLFNGDKEKSDDLHKFANENWQFVHKLTRQPAMEAFMKKFINNVNAYLDIIPIEDLLYRD